MLLGMWDFPQSEIETVSAALAGGPFTAEPPGKPDEWYFLDYGEIAMIFLPF